MKNKQNPTEATYSQLDKAYSHFNHYLFENKLPNCVITLHRKKNASGYFWGNTWTSRDGEEVTDEIALNPEHFIEQSIEDILSTLVHEMCHLQQHHYGKPSRNGYHNKEWANMMSAVGLIASDTGEEGGKMTGQNMTHYIEPQGRFEQVCTILLEADFTIPWQAVTLNISKGEKKTSAKTKYSCPCCDLNVWGKSDLNISCGDCETTLEPDEPSNAPEQENETEADYTDLEGMAIGEDHAKIKGIFKTLTDELKKPKGKATETPEDEPTSNLHPIP